MGEQHENTAPPRRQRRWSATVFPLSKLSTLQVTAHVYDDGMLGVKMPTGLRSGAYVGVLVLKRQEGSRAADAPEAFVPLPQYLEQAKADYVRGALDTCGGNRTQAAELLGIDVRAVFRMLSEDDR